MQVTLAGSVYPYKPSDDDLSRTSIELAAFDGEVGNGVLIIRDPASSYNVATGRQALVEEGSVVLSDGFMLDQDRTRGFTPAVAREYSFGLADANALLDGFRISRRRPLESDYDRVMFFAGEDIPDADTTWVLDANTTTMPAKRYYGDGGWTSELIPDVISFTGKTLFLHDKADGSGRCLHYHVLTTGHTCGLAISDVISDSLGSATTFFPQEPQRTRTSIDLRNDIKGVDQSGRVSFASDSASKTAHDADGLLHEAQLDVEASNQSDLDVQTAAFLASQKDDLDTYTCTIGPLDATALGLIRVGDLITVTSTVMGLSASAKRISHMTLVPVIGEGSKSYVGLWMAALEMGAPVRRRARVSARTPLPDMEPFVCIEPDYTVLSDTDSPQLFTIFPNHMNGQSSRSTDFTTLYNGATYRVDYECYHAPGPDPVGSNALTASVGQVAGGVIGTPGPTPGTSTAPPAVNMGDIRGPDGCTFNPPNDIPLASVDWFVVTAGPPTMDVQAALVEQSCTSGDSFGSSLSVVFTYLDGPDPRFEDLPTCSNVEPAPGQEVHDAPITGDGTTDSGTTQFGYAPGSLTLIVNGVDWTDQVTEVDPPTGTYTVAYPFPLGAVVLVRYRSD